MIRRFFTPISPIRIQSRLLCLAGIFLFLYTIILTLSPTVRERSWAVDFQWSQWLILAIWISIFALVHIISRRRLPDADPFIIPIAALLSGWGALTIFRLIPSFGLRQATWLLLCGLVIATGLYLPSNLFFLRRYKYIWLTGGLLLTALTLVFGTDPGGGNEHAWLGCCGFFFQPSEPLKLLLIVYLAAYFADRFPINIRPVPLIAPTVIVFSVALTLLVIQHDLGTASIFIFLYSMILYIASGKKRILLISLVALVVAGIVGYFLFDLIRLRVDAWLNPWLDPSGRSFQIVQSLMAVANGGIIGRGPGLGSPGLVPVAISDFVFTSIAEETGFVGTVGLLVLIGFFSTRGIRIAMRAPDNFRRILAGGITAYLGAQTILIIGGNIRLLPLTGVTLPFVSYGGSSLLTSFLGLLLLLFISDQQEEEPAPLPKPQPYQILSGVLALGLIALSISNAWWAVVRGPVLLGRTDNVRRSIADRYVKRGSLEDRSGTPINITEGKSGEFVRRYLYTPLGPITGYTNPVYGQSGLEASLDLYLRGMQGNPASSIWWDHLVYGQPPPGLNVRLSLDLRLQRKADVLLGNRKGAIVLINAATGEIFAMVSHPTFDPNELDFQATTLLKDPNSPLLDRAAQGMYPPGDALQPFFLAAGYDTRPSKSIVENLFASLGFYTTPELMLPMAVLSSPMSSLRISPLQMVLASATLSANGVRPAPRLAMAVDTPEYGWVIIPALSQPVQVFSSVNSANTANIMLVRGDPIWQWNSTASMASQTFSWSIGGSLPNLKSVPLAIVVLLEENDLLSAGNIGRTLLESVINP